MKKIGHYTVRGQITAEASEDRITLFDGSFASGYKVVRFDIMPGSWAGDANDSFAILYTESGAATNAFNPNFGDNRQIGWAASTVVTAEEIAGTQTIIDPDNLIIEDLFITVRGDAGVNYIVELEKYDITEWQGALSMVRNSSQNND